MIFRVGVWLVSLVTQSITGLSYQLALSSMRMKYISLAIQKILTELNKNVFILFLMENSGPCLLLLMTNLYLPVEFRESKIIFMKFKFYNFLKMRKRKRNPPKRI